MEILKTLINRPTRSDTLINRYHLIDRLNQGVDKPVTLISAGPGYGKTTLVNQWLDSVKLPFTWISCEESMNELSQFIHYFTVGLKNSVSVDFSQTMGMLGSLVEVSKEVLLYKFLSELSELSQRHLVVIDDFHLINDGSVIELFQKLLKYPFNLHICILTRYDPKDILSGHRMKNQVNELTMKDLHLTQTEISNYAVRCHKIQLAEIDIANLQKGTEGWILGVNQALVMHLQSGNQHLKMELSGSHQLNNLFLKEVILKESNLIKDLLLVASIFNRFSRNLLDHVLSDCLDYNDIGSPDLIEELQSSAYFLISLDSEGKWYRFHHQFQQTLQDYFHKKGNLTFTLACLKSGSNWMINNSYYEEGIEKGIETNEADFAVEQLVKIKYHLLNTDQYQRLKNLIAFFPLDWQDNSLEILISKAICNENEGKHEVMAVLLQKINDRLNDQKVTNQVLSEYYILSGQLLYFEGLFEECLSYLDKGKALCNPNAESIITFANAYMSLALDAQGKLEQAIQELRRYQDSLNQNQHFSIVRTLAAKALLHSMHGNLHEIKQLNTQMKSISYTKSFYEILGFSYYFKAEINYRQNKFTELTEVFENCRRIRYQMRPVWYGYLLIIKAFSSLKLKKPQQLDDTLLEFQEFCNDLKANNLEQLRRAALAEIAFQKGSITEASKLTFNTKFDLYPPIFYHFIPQITALKIKIKNNPKDQLIQLQTEIEELQRYGRKMDHGNTIVQTYLLLSLLNWRLGDMDRAVDSLLSALTITKPNNDILVYTEFGDEIRDIILGIPNKRKNNQHIKDVTEALKTYQLSDSSNSIHYFYSLKKRDIRLLQLVEQGYKNDEIGEAMFLSTESVKKYLYDIYQQLGVKNRINAVLKANELGLLDSSKHNS